MRPSRQFSFLNGPKKLDFVRMYGSTITGLVGPPHPYCLLVAFCTFFCFWCVQNLFVKKKKEFKTALITLFTIWGYQDTFKPVFFLQKDITHTKTLTSKNQLTKQK